MGHRQRGREGLWSLLALGCCVLPMLGHRLMPCMDLPQHLAIGSVLWRLLAAGGEGGPLPYAAALQPMPYYLVYLGLAPLTGLAGPEVGARLSLGLLAAAQLAANAVCLRAARAPAWANLAGVVMFFGPLFYFGFVATMAGLPCIMLMVAGLLHWQRGGRSRALAAAALAAALATLAHALLALPCAVVALSFAWRGAPRAARARRPAAALVVAAAAALPLGPALWVRAGATATALHGIVWPHPDVSLSYFKGFLGPFDHGAGRAAHLALLLALAAGAWRQRRAAAARPLLPAIALILVAFALFPRALVTGSSPAWGLSFRLLSVAELLLLPLLPPLGAAASRRAVAAVAACLAVHMAAQWRVWDRFDAAAAPLHAALAALPASAGLAVEAAGHVPLRAAWPPVLSHLGAYHVARGGRCASSVFCGGHLPIRGAGPCGREDAEYLLQQAGGDESLPPPPPGARPLFAAGPWRLLALAAAAGR